MKALAAVLAVTVAGCSAFMDTVPKGWEPAQGEPKCSALLDAPIIDLVVGAAFAALVVASIVDYSSCEEEEVFLGCDTTLLGGLFLSAISIPYLANGGVGLKKRSKCREAKREYALWQERSPEARTLFKKACDAGDAGGCNNLGFLWLKGEGGPSDPVKARALYKKACDAGVAVSCLNLGNMWVKGEGGPNDPAKARALYKKACDAGYAAACSQ